MRAGRVILAIVGAVLAITAFGMLAAGAGLLWAESTQKDAGGFFNTPTVELETDSYALASTEIDLGARPGDWFPTGSIATVRIEAQSGTDAPLFIGIGPEDAVESYLAGSGFAEVTRIREDGSDYTTTEGQAPPAPGEQEFWVASTSGSGAQQISWDVAQGNWTVVIMKADASPGVEVLTSAGVRTSLLVPIAGVLLAGGLLMAAVAAVLLVLATRREGEPAPLSAGAAGAGPYPLVLTGRPEPDAGRWLWLVKWLLIIPHVIVLAFLFTAFVLLTIVAFFGILFTGRYPRSIFDFNVGVMRWGWRVAYYSYSALGTDRYPPFTLDEVADYPAGLQVEYPEQLSRGLVLVKWWLLAIPHYLIVGLLTSGLVWWTTELGDTDAVARTGGGLIGILVLIAAVVLAVTGRYPQGLYDLIMGLNRWVYRVGAYAALMTDEYPPFRLDTGGGEPGPGPDTADTSSPPPATPPPATPPG
jgi:hypothetical protein